MTLWQWISHKSIPRRGRQGMTICNSLIAGMGKTINDYHVFYIPLFSPSKGDVEGVYSLESLLSFLKY
jgi:hypothetical protein